jgi:NADP-dependent 3-hydroxy acid dehydrogenase YdfG
MTETKQPIFRRALIVGAGSGLGASLARLLSGNDMRIALAARNPDKLKALCEESGATAFKCDAAKVEDVESLFRAVENSIGPPDEHEAEAVRTLVPEGTIKMTTPRRAAARQNVARP